MTTILIILVIFFLLRLLFPTLLRLFFRRMTRPHRNQNVAYKKGETTITSHGKEHSEVPKNFGDYTEYEEVKN